MALQIQLATSSGTSLDVIDFDAAVTESHSFNADVTDFPVEDGSNVTDNVRAKPVMLKLETFISDNPLPTDGRSQSSTGAITARAPSTLSRSKGALQTLTDWQIGGQILTVLTGIKTYSSMVIQSIDLPRDKSLKGGLRLTLTLKQIRIVSTQQVEVSKAKEAKGEKKAPTGPQTTHEAESGPTRSIADSLAHGFFGAF